MYLCVYLFIADPASNPVTVTNATVASFQHRVVNEGTGVCMCQGFIRIVEDIGASSTLIGIPYFLSVFLFPSYVCMIPKAMHNSFSPLHNLAFCELRVYSVPPLLPDPHPGRCCVYRISALRPLLMQLHATLSTAGMGPGALANGCNRRNSRRGRVTVNPALLVGDGDGDRRQEPLHVDGHICHPLLFY